MTYPRTALTPRKLPFFKQVDFVRIIFIFRTVRLFATDTVTQE